MRILLLATVSMFLVLATGGRALACDCMTPSPKECLQRADVVFEGELIRIGRTADGYPTSYTFRINKMLKGRYVNEVTIFSEWTDCDASFSPDIVYRVFAHEFKGKLISGICSGNEVLEKKPVPVSYAIVEKGSVWQLWYVKALLIAATALVLILAVHLLTKKPASATRRVGSVRRY